MTSESLRASEVSESIRTLFRKVDQDREPVDLNDVTLEVLKLFREELHDHNRLHFEHFHCVGHATFCNQSGCLHQEYALENGRYRLVRSFYASGND